MKLDKKTGITLAIVLILGVAVWLFLPWKCSAQSLSGVTHEVAPGGYNLNITLFFTSEEATSLLRGLGADKSLSDVKNAIGQEALRAAQREVEMAEANNESNWLPFVPDAAWETARTRYEVYRDTVGTFRRIQDSLAQEIGMIAPFDPDDGVEWAHENPARFGWANTIGKSYSPSFMEVYDAAYREVAPDRFQFADGPGDFFTTVGVVGLIVAIVVLGLFLS
jgi:hypothetical protein